VWFEPCGGAETLPLGGRASDNIHLSQYPDDVTWKGTVSVSKDGEGRQLVLFL